MFLYIRCTKQLLPAKRKSHPVGGHCRPCKYNTTCAQDQQHTHQLYHLPTSPETNFGSRAYSEKGARTLVVIVALTEMADGATYEEKPKAEYSHVSEVKNRLIMR